MKLKLTQKELEVLALLAIGCTRKEIAFNLKRSLKAIDKRILESTKTNQITLERLMFLYGREIESSKCHHG